MTFKSFFNPLNIKKLILKYTFNIRCLQIYFFSVTVGTRNKEQVGKLKIIPYCEFVPYCESSSY